MVDTTTIDACFANGSQCDDSVVAAFLAVLESFGNGIASIVLDKRFDRGYPVESEHCQKGRADYAALATIMAQEIAYGVADCHIVRFESVVPTTVQRHKTRVSKVTGKVWTIHEVCKGYVINGTYEVYSNYVARELYNNAAKYAGKWIVLVASGNSDTCYNATCKVKRGDMLENGKREKLGILPDTSFLKTLFRTVLSCFESQNGHSDGTFDEFTTETKSARKSAGYRETDVDVELLLGSDDFSEQDKNVLRAVEMTLDADSVGSVVENLAFTDESLRDDFRTTFEGLRGKPVEPEYFDKIVRNLRKKIVRFFRKMNSNE
jgi:hypothetical protein